MNTFIRTTTISHKADIVEIYKIAGVVMIVIRDQGTEINRALNVAEQETLIMRGTMKVRVPFEKPEPMLAKRIVVSTEEITIISESGECCVINIPNMRSIDMEIVIEEGE